MQLIVYVLSNVTDAVAFEWISTHLDKSRFRLHFVLLNPEERCRLVDFFESQHIPYTWLPYHHKRQLPGVVWRLYRLLGKLRPTAVHTHLFEASLAGLLAARLAGVRQRIHTRHHATLHHRYFPRAVWYDKAVNALSTDIVAISENVRRVLLEKERVSPQKISLIHHGFLWEHFEAVSPERVAAFRERYQLPEGRWVVGVISRYTHLKGIEYIIEGFEQLLTQAPEACLVLANATGDYAGVIRQKLQTLPADSYREIVFERDIAAFYALMQAFVHVPIDPEVEAFGQIYIEAMAAGVPSIVTLSGVAPEYIQDGLQAWVVPFEDGPAIGQQLLRIYQNPQEAKDITQKAQETVRRRFALKNMVNRLEALYQKNSPKY
jgi:glycosyltransferase involved in cell wall biosynthesis